MEIGEFKTKMYDNNIFLKVRTKQRLIKALAFIEGTFVARCFSTSLPKISGYCRIWSSSESMFRMTVSYYHNYLQLSNWEIYGSIPVSM